MSGIAENLRGRRWLIIIAVLLVFVCCLLLAFTPLGKALADFVGINLGGTPEVTPTTVGTEQVTTEVTLPPTEEPTETVEPTREVTEEVTQEVTPEITSTIEVGKGACNDICDPRNSNCLAGLECLPVAGANKYVCWNDAICLPTPVPTQAVTEERPCICGDGVCEQARCQEFTMNCPQDCGPNPDPCATNYCGDGVCRCGETPYTCPKPPFGSGDC